MHVLIIDDSLEMQLLLRQIVVSTGVKVTTVGTAQAARVHLQDHKPSLILLDLGLPDTDGFHFFSELQSSELHRQIPVVFITGRAEVTNKVAAFSLGAEDYIVKPFDALEVKARLGARLKKLTATQESHNSVIRGPIEIDVARQRVFCGTGPSRAPVKLTRKEFLLLTHLARHEDTVISRQQLLDAVWGNESEVFDRTVDTHISALRRKLGSYGTCVESVAGMGYRFTARPAGHKAA
ncbi:MAG: response regulator transcription factor [Bdellovibrionota bacterium]